jgi:hypothetical protein
MVRPEIKPWRRRAGQSGFVGRQFQAHPFKSATTSGVISTVGFGFHARPLGVCCTILSGAVISTGAAGFLGRFQRGGRLVTIRGRGGLPARD